MRNVSYYSFNDKRKKGLGNCSACLDTAPLIVNCAGSFLSQSPFTTHNTEGRLDYYLMHILSGTLLVRLPEGEMTVSEGDTVIFPPKYKYYYRYTAEGKPLNYLWAHFTGSAAGEYLDTLGLDSLPALRHSRKDALAELHFERMFELYSSDDALRQTALAAILLETLVELARSWKEDEKQTSLSRSLAYINSRYTERIKVEELAKLENLSPSRYQVVFKEKTGVPPLEYVLGLRLRHACGLLASTDMPIYRIAELAGYDDQRFFCRLFKRKLGITPTEYRNPK